MEKIIRNLEVDRGGRKVIYPFTTFPCVFERNGSLMEYLAEIITSGAPEGLKSVTEQPELLIKPRKCTYDQITSLAEAAGYQGRGRLQHSIVQNYFLDHDEHTIATEIPVFNNKLRGHIDILRLMPDGTIEILDFKPDAHRETKATSQLYRYYKLLKASLGPGHKFEAYYFDDKSSYQVTL